MNDKRQNKLIKWLRIIVVLYVLIGAALYFWQDKFLLHPVSLPPHYRFQFEKPFSETLVKYNSTISFDIVRFKPQIDSIIKGAVIYCHGNMENINHYTKFVSNFTKHGYEVWMMDYPGFGKSTGDRTEQIFYDDAIQL